MATNRELKKGKKGPRHNKEKKDKWTGIRTTEQRNRVQESENIQREGGGFPERIMTINRQESKQTDRQQMITQKAKKEKKKGTTPNLQKNKGKNFGGREKYNQAIHQKIRSRSHPKGNPKKENSRDKPIAGFSWKRH